MNCVDGLGLVEFGNMAPQGARQARKINSWGRAGTVNTTTDVYHPTSYQLPIRFTETLH